MNLRPKQRPPPRPVGVRRAERELFFWTVRQSLKLIVSLAAAVGAVVSLFRYFILGDAALVELMHDLMTLLS